MLMFDYEYQRAWNESKRGSSKECYCHHAIEGDDTWGCNARISKTCLFTIPNSSKCILGNRCAIF
jgi:hypothetical protein